MAYLSTGMDRRRGFGWFSLLLAVAVLGTLSGTALAAGPSPQPPPHYPDPSETFDTAGDIDAPAAAMLLPALKAVVTVGNIDGPNGIATLSAIANMEPAVEELIARGVSVQKFYPPNDDWNAIKAAANGAHFFYYGGHGISDGEHNYGGMWFAGKDYISPAEIKTNLKLAKNAIVFLFACYAAGSDGTEVNLTGAEALHRVSQYSDAFFAVGAAGYYSNWKTKSFQVFTRNIFSGLSLGDAFKNYSDYNAATAEIYTHQSFPNIALWLDKDYFYGGYKYDNAFGGYPDLTLADLFATEMVTHPSPIIGLTTPQSPPQVTYVTVSSTKQVSFTWTASLSITGDWATISETSGESDSRITLTLIPGGLDQGIYHATLNVHANSTGVISPDQSIPVILKVSDIKYKTYLPVTIQSENAIPASPKQTTPIIPVTGPDRRENHESLLYLGLAVLAVVGLIAAGLKLCKFS